MDILAPIDGSDCSFRALRFAADFARRYEADLDVVHFTDSRGRDTESLLERAEELLDEEGVRADPEVVTDVRLGNLKASDQVGRDILDLVEDRGYDHVVMGHHGSGMVEELLLGSAAETVIEPGSVTVTIVP
ncbi:universal stress protein [Halobacteriaceae archaeon GCM10025711]